MFLLLGVPGNGFISIHALREEGDGYGICNVIPNMVFLSTPSVRRATTARSDQIGCTANFYPRPP